MPFNSDTARQAAETKKQIKAIDTIDTQVSREKVALAKLRHDDRFTRYYITSPLALAPDNIKATAMKLVLQVHPGPTKYQDEDGHQVMRSGGEVVLLEGEGITMDKLWAEYLQQEWPELTVSEVPSSNLASYRQEIDEVKELIGAS